jgi:hypothetical protein
MATDFRPLDGASVYAQSTKRDLPFIVASMFTTDFRAVADRLKSSLEQLRLNFVLYQVPTIHSSISAAGTDDLAFCKPNFIHQVQDRHRLPILYVDADVVFRRLPKMVSQLTRQRVDFAAYNWLADASNDAYLPVELVYNGVAFANRFYRFSHSVDYLDPKQLIVSGAAQYHAPGAALLRQWLDTIARFPRAADDQSLDYAYNSSFQKGLVRATWWEKDYCRYPWWIHVRPVIDHPAFPSRRSNDGFLKSVAGLERVDSSRPAPRPAAGVFPRDCLIDTQEKCLLQVDSGGEAILVGRFATDLWVSDSPTRNGASIGPGSR